MTDLQKRKKKHILTEAKSISFLFFFQFAISDDNDDDYDDKYGSFL